MADTPITTSTVSLSYPAHSGLQYQVPSNPLFTSTARSFFLFHPRDFHRLANRYSQEGRNSLSAAATNNTTPYKSDGRFIAIVGASYVICCPTKWNCWCNVLRERPAATFTKDIGKIFHMDEALNNVIVIERNRQK